MSAISRLGAGQPEAALEAARSAIDRDPRLEWGHRIASLALERLGQDEDAVDHAERAVRLAPGSWAARLRLARALCRLPGRWRESWTQAAKALWFAPEEPDVRVLVGDLALVRGEHRRAAVAYRAALRGDPDHPGARINLGLTMLRWERAHGPYHEHPGHPGHPDHPDHAVDPKDAARTRRAFEMWTRQVRVLLAVAIALVAATAFGAELSAEARVGGLLLLLPVIALTVRQARRVPLWRHASALLARDARLGLAVCVTPVTVLAYTAAVLTLPDSGVDRAWTSLAGWVLLNGPIIAVAKVLADAWRGRPVRALAEFAAALPERTARRDAGVGVWIVVARAWSVLLTLAGLALLSGEPPLALGAAVVPLALARAWRVAGLGGRVGAILTGDRVLAVVLVLLAVACLALSLAAALPEAALWAWCAGVGALTAMAVAFGVRAARAWWRGSPGPWRASLVMCDGCGRRLPGDVRPAVGLSEEVRRAFTSSRGVVLAYSGPSGPRALAVGAVTSVGPAGELRLIAGDEAWQAAERDPRVAVFVADPADRRFWAEVRGIALGDPEAEVLRVTPKEVVVGEYPGRHQGRHQDDRPGRT
ncbi:tetratricopeptide repeat protein [Spongiactinospora sp. TRM90649]|uniref:tetratricopeptide repeat protein n=1 Tax=Spongiactinospora sp. TRM90649 TaxID=3031114 RepID=UPI0023F6E4A2|nr:tetratricopeptide repeat protein [Spongiactinospora sp. TRM90649]MDF5755366.1 hypothetical protein [Spongiactinospora sp. TRM90649]